MGATPGVPDSILGGIALLLVTCAILFVAWRSIRRQARDTPLLLPAMAYCFGAISIAFALLPPLGILDTMGDRESVVIVTLVDFTESDEDDGLSCILGRVKRDGQPVVLLFDNVIADSTVKQSLRNLQPGDVISSLHKLDAHGQGFPSAIRVGDRILFGAQAIESYHASVRNLRLVIALVAASFFGIGFVLQLRAKQREPKVYLLNRLQLVVFPLMVFVVVILHEFLEIRGITGWQRFAVVFLGIALLSSLLSGKRDRASQAARFALSGKDIAAITVWESLQDEEQKDPDAIIHMVSAYLHTGQTEKASTLLFELAYRDDLNDTARASVEQMKQELTSLQEQGDEAKKAFAEKS